MLKQPVAIAAVAVVELVVLFLTVPLGISYLHFIHNSSI